MTSENMGHFNGVAYQLLNCLLFDSIMSVNARSETNYESHAVVTERFLVLTVVRHTLTAWL